MKKDSKPKDYYIDDKKFTKEIIDYVLKNQEWIKTHNHRMTPNSYIGDCILKIAKRLSKSPNFINYSWLNDMIDEAIFLSCKYIDRFNPYIDVYDEKFDEEGNLISKELISRELKQTGAFNYFTTVAFNAFRMTITNEKKRLAGKKAILENDILNQANYTLLKTDDDSYQVLSMYEGIINMSNDNYDSYFED